jgi:hypothetical protein
MKKLLLNICFFLIIQSLYAQIIDSSRIFRPFSPEPSLIKNLSKISNPEAGLTGNNIALWSSHGYYYKNEENRWTWQRPKLFGIVEDLLTKSIVLPFLIPMLENAGALTFYPRERDTRTEEIIVDNDFKNTSSYKEFNDRLSWKPYEKGFSDGTFYYIYGENPFEKGTSRQIETITDTMESSSVEWTPDIPVRGFYAVYLSWQTLENSTRNASYTVHHLGGATKFRINQKLMGGTWVYVGHFMFDKGKNRTGKVVLTNLSDSCNQIITADAVKFGGGMGNISKGLVVNPDGTLSTGTSNMPKYTEGARYWLQWAGYPDSIYSRSANINDYTDDFQSRGHWVNYLAGGSSVNPQVNGKGIPVDLSFSMHTDAGILQKDSTIGTLSISTVRNSDGLTVFKNGSSREISLEMANLIHEQLVGEIRKLHRPDWTKREVWNKSYSESRVPEVPALLLELLSHQNFTDMIHGLDPTFRFDVARSIYKGMLKHLAKMYQREYVVQPLPVKRMSCFFTQDETLRIQWEPTSDSLEASANPDYYILYTRMEDGDFNHGQVIYGNFAELRLKPGKTYSFKVTALNKGGESFPSEILSACKMNNTKETVLIVNGFTRVSGPDYYANDSTAGFLFDHDGGVPYISDLSRTGIQTDFNRKSAFVDNEIPGHGASTGELAGKPIPGNTFDFPYIHGRAIKQAGHTFISVSADAYMNNDFPTDNYKIIDLILGKQKQIPAGTKSTSYKFKTFPLALQLKLRDFCNRNGNLFVSGAYVASDLFKDSIAEDMNFATQVLKIRPLQNVEIAGENFAFKSERSSIFSFRDTFKYQQRPGGMIYQVEKPDYIKPVDEKAFVISGMSRNQSTGVIFKDNYKLCVLTIPFETITEEEDRFKLMDYLLNFYHKK